MNFDRWLEDSKAQGLQYFMQRETVIKAVFSMTAGKDAARWTYIKKPFSREDKEYFVFDGERLFKIIFGDSDKKQVESWNIKGLNKISYQIYMPKNVEVSVLDLHIGEDCIRFSSEVDISENLATTKEWAPVYNELIEALYKMLITQS